MIAVSPEETPYWGSCFGAYLFVLADTRPFRRRSFLQCPLMLDLSAGLGQWVRAAQFSGEGIARGHQRTVPGLWYGVFEAVPALASAPVPPGLRGMRTVRRVAATTARCRAVFTCGCVMTYEYGVIVSVCMISYKRLWVVDKLYKSSILNYQNQALGMMVFVVIVLGSLTWSKSIGKCR